MNLTTLKRYVPTFMAYWEKRQRAARNKLPKHLRPPAVWPAWIQILVNLSVIFALWTLMVNKDEYLTEAGPAITLVVCLLLLIYTVINAVRMRVHYRQTPGQRWATVNFWLMVIAFLSWPATVAVFLP